MKIDISVFTGIIAFYLAAPLALAAPVKVVVKVELPDGQIVHTQYLCRNGASSAGEIQGASTDPDIARAQIKASPTACKTLLPPKAAPAKAGTAIKLHVQAWHFGDNPELVTALLYGSSSYGGGLAGNSPGESLYPSTYRCRSGNHTERGELIKPHKNSDVARAQLDEAATACSHLPEACTDVGNSHGRRDAMREVAKRGGDTALCTYAYVPATPLKTAALMLAAPGKCKGDANSFHKGYLAGESSYFAARRKALKCNTVAGSDEDEDKGTTKPVQAPAAKGPKKGKSAAGKAAVEDFDP